MKLTINKNKIIFGLVILFGVLIFPSITRAFSYSWTGNEADLPVNPSCEVTENGTGEFRYTVTCDHEEGTEIYKININGTTSSCDGKSVSYETNYLDNLPISYGPSRCHLTLSLNNPIGEGTVTVTVTGSVVPSGTSEPKCAGGTRTQLVCTPAGGWEKTTCPYDASTGPHGDYFICPFESDLQAVFSRELDPWVLVEGVDTRGDNKVYREQMTVSQNSPFLIRWYSNDVTRCTCTYNGVNGDCGTGTSIDPSEAVYANDGGSYKLTSDKTFLVECW